MVIQYEINNELIGSEELESILGSRSVAKAMLRLAERIADSLATSICTQHNETPVVTVVMSEARGIGIRVSGCCQHFVDEIQSIVRKVMFDTARLTTSHASAAGLNLIVTIDGSDKVFEFDVAAINKVMIGRIDPDTGERPEIDLTEFGAYDNGVSRRHATIINWNRGLFVVDEGSPNGTFLNGSRLTAGEPNPLKYGDNIRIGRLILEVTLDYPQHATV
jgi:hypothetical protein